jgi:serine/threonine-protein kinase RsbW
MANVTRHAYAGAVDRPIEVRGCCDGDAVRLTIRDWGNGVNPESLPRRPKDPLTPGGLGLICLRSLIDELTFAPQPDGMLLTMTKRK